MNYLKSFWTSSSTEDVDTMSTDWVRIDGASPKPFPVPHAVLPYWRTELHELDEHRSTPDLPTECDVVIIGSGMAGVTTAYHLLEDNPSPPKIVLLEARQLCSGATARNGGHVKIKVPTIATWTERWGVEAGEQIASYVYGILDGLKALTEKEDLDCEFELRRSVDVYLDEKQGRQAKAMFDKYRKTDLKWAKNMTFIDERFAEQVTSIKGAKAVFNGPGCSFWPYKFVSQLLARAISRYPDHLNFQTNTPVSSVATANDFHLVHTPRGSLKCRKVVYATNGWTAGLLPSFENVITPYRGMNSHHAIPAGKPRVRPHLSCTYNIDFGPEKGIDYFNPRPDGSIVVGGAKWKFSKDTELWYNNWDDSFQFSKDAMKHWDGYMQRKFYGWENSGAVTDMVWVGIMALTPDEMPHIGQVPGTEDQYILAGFNGGGMSMILTASKVVAQMIREDCEYEVAAKEFNVPTLFKSTAERMKEKNGFDALKRT